MTRLIIVRHGESEGNAKHEFHGNYNSDITERGHAQAECTAKFLDNYQIDAIYSSDIKRAYSTALHTAVRKNLPVIKCEGVREIFAGKWERMTFSDIQACYPEDFKLWHEDIANCRCPGGESVAELAQRVKMALDKIACENDGKTVMIATHATPIRSMYCVWNNLPLAEMKNIHWAPNASVTIVDYDNKGNYNLSEYALCDHLADQGLLTKLPKNI